MSHFVFSVIFPKEKRKLMRKMRKMRNMTSIKYKIYTDGISVGYLSKVYRFVIVIGPSIFLYQKKVFYICLSLKRIKERK